MRLQLYINEHLQLPKFYIGNFNLHENNIFIFSYRTYIPKLHETVLKCVLYR